jgi:uncharacterized protein with HEPN domain
MPHDRETLLKDVQRAVRLIQQFTVHRSESDYRSDEMLRAAVEREFTIIGEALTRLEKLDATTLSQITDVRKIIGFRNVLLHGYELIDDAVVWRTIIQYLPVLKNDVERLLGGFESA